MLDVCEKDENGQVEAEEVSPDYMWASAVGNPTHDEQFATGWTRDGVWNRMPRVVVSSSIEILLGTISQLELKSRWKKPKLLSISRSQSHQD